MPQFNPGDQCVVVPSRCSADDPQAQTLLGAECEVLGLSRHPLAALFLALAPDHARLRVTVTSGEFAGIEAELCQTCLRKRKPPQEKASWSLIKKLTGWLPKPAAIPEVAYG